MQKFDSLGRINNNGKMRVCKYCNEERAITVIKRHEKSCYLNPDNLKLCPVCEKPIRYYRENKTCGIGCSNTYFRSGKNNGNFKTGESSHREKCFKAHGKKCIICGESIVVDSHHRDWDRTNNGKENLVPVCPTHHQYFHRGFGHLLQDKLNEWVINNVDVA